MMSSIMHRAPGSVVPVQPSVRTDRQAFRRRAPTVKRYAIAEPSSFSSSTKVSFTPSWKLQVRHRRRDARSVASAPR